ncbi:hypothetical protein [Nocardioides sp.]|uniref:hypothetical protein n=1 Tax=Nocardioides sp. TaxID=35761 RepID=UPI0027353AE0|nr:hypothetical protein [Nocardioides sp.]
MVPVLATGLLAAGCGSGGSGAGQDSAYDAPPAAPTSPPVPTDEAEPPAPELEPVDPVEGRRERQVGWKLVGPAPGPIMVVEVQAGGAPCDAITGLDVTETPDVITLIVWAGREPGAACAGQPAVLGTFHVRVPLEEPFGDRRVEQGGS